MTFDATWAAKYAARVPKAAQALEPITGKAKPVRMILETQHPLADLINELELEGIRPPTMEHRFHPVRRWRFEIGRAHV